MGEQPAPEIPPTEPPPKDNDPVNPTGPGDSEETPEPEDD